MSEGTSTPGPWTLSDVRAFGRRKVEAWVQEPSGHRWRKTLAEMLDGNLDEGEAEANARLIAAAPDLLAACKEIASFAQSWQPLSTGDIASVRAAIAKAEAK